MNLTTNVDIKYLLEQLMDRFSYYFRNNEYSDLINEINIYQLFHQSLSD